MLLGTRNDTYIVCKSRQYFEREHHGKRGRDILFKKALQETNRSFITMKAHIILEEIIQTFGSNTTYLIDIWIVTQVSDMDFTLGAILVRVWIYT